MKPTNILKSIYFRILGWMTLSSTRVLNIQTEMTERALEMLKLDPEIPGLILDIGCGSGISGAIITEAGHNWVGLDISRHMLGNELEST